MFLSKLSIKRPILVTMGLLALMIFGGLAYRDMSKNLMPDVSPPYISIQTIYPGAGPKEVEMQITKKIEDAIASVSGIRMMQSFSMDNVSIVMLEFEISKNPDIASQEVKDKIDLIINDMPSGSQDPIVQKFNMQEIPIMDFVLSGDLDATELYEIADKQLKDRLSQINGVGSVTLTGGREREIHINVDGLPAYENYISMPQLMQIISAANIDMPGGYYQAGELDYTVRLKGKFDDLEDIEELEIQTAFGNKKLRDIAEVEDAGDIVREKAVYYDNRTYDRNENVVRLSLVKNSDGNASEIAETVYKEIDDIRATLPSGVSFDIANDDSEFTEQSIQDTIDNVLLGVLFTSIVLLVFLHDLRSTIIVAISMPAAIIITFYVLQLFGLTKNILSLMGLSVSVGVLVSNSVVVIENIFRHKYMGKNNADAADAGTSEVTTAVIAATLTNICVFVPIAMMDSMVGMMLGEAAIAASAATAISILTAFTLTPMLASLILPKGNPKLGFISKFMDKIEKGYTNIYSWMLKGALKNGFVSFLVILGVIAILVLTVAVYGTRLKFGFFPASDTGKIQVTMELPVGYNLETTNGVAEEIENKLKKHPGIEYTLTSLGKKGDSDIGVNLAKMDVYLKDVSERDTSSFDYVTMLTEELSDIPNVKLGVVNLSGFGDGGAPIELNLTGSDMEVLSGIASDLMSQYQEIPGILNLENTLKTGKPEVVVTPDKKKVADAGLTVQTIAYTLMTAIEGLEAATQYEENGEEYKMIITLDEEFVDSPEKVGLIPLVSQAGIFRVNQLCDIEITDGYTTILHLDKGTNIKFSAYNAQGTSTGQIMNEMTKINEAYDFPAGYKIAFGGMAQMQGEMMADMMFAFVLAILLTYMLLAAVLESFVQPFIILLTVPLALIGSILAMYITNLEIGMSAMLGVIMLIGIVVNNAILIMDMTNQLIREGGMKPKDALIKAAPTKLKAILMSTIAIILGMLPMALGMGESMSEMRQPMGVIAIGGLVASTTLTLFVVPAFYYLNTSIGTFVKNLFKKPEKS
jgi:HAE1 family hydrophobic/amphiphilic exporter-1